MKLIEYTNDPEAEIMSRLRQYNIDVNPMNLKINEKNSLVQEEIDAYNKAIESRDLDKIKEAIYNLTQAYSDPQVKKEMNQTKSEHLMKRDTHMGMSQSLSRGHSYLRSAHPWHTNRPSIHDMNKKRGVI